MSEPRNAHVVFGTRSIKGDLPELTPAAPKPVPEDITQAIIKHYYCEVVKKREANLTPEQRANRSKRTKKQWLDMTPEQRTNLLGRIKKGFVNMTPEQRSERSKKQWLNMTPEQRSEVVKKRWGREAKRVKVMNDVASV